MEVAQPAEDVVAEEIGGSDNDTDQAKNAVLAMVGRVKTVTVMRIQIDFICMIQMNLTMKWLRRKW